MSDATNRFFPTRLPFFLVLALLPCLLSNSCASSTPARKVQLEKGLSPSAETDYLFLVYQDLLREDRKGEAMHNNANVLCLGERVVGQGLAASIVEVFLATAFEGGRHQRRIDGIETCRFSLDDANS